MSWGTMSSELTGQCPVNINFAFILVNRAWRQIQRQYLWSFLWGDCAIPTIAPVSTGTVTTTLGSATVTADATAKTAWAAIGLITPVATLQFRVGTGTIYNILNYDSVGGTITLDKIFVDPGAGAGNGYSLQLFYPSAPVQDFLWWEEFKDPVTGYNLGIYKTRGEVDEDDPQRVSLGIPADVIPYQINPVTGFPQYEIWPAPAGLTYVGQYYRSGSDFVSPTDTVASPLGEDVVLEKAKYLAYEWCEANKDKLQPAQRQGDFRYLMGQSKKEFDGLINDYILKDETFSRRHIIKNPQNRNGLVLPWVSQKQGLAFLPD
jgi:hypothetical protein